MPVALPARIGATRAVVAVMSRPATMRVMSPSARFWPKKAMSARSRPAVMRACFGTDRIRPSMSPAAAMRTGSESPAWVGVRLCRALRPTWLVLGRMVGKSKLWPEVTPSWVAVKVENTPGRTPGSASSMAMVVGAMSRPENRRSCPVGLGMRIIAWAALS